MPVIYKKNIEESCWLGIWEIKESMDELKKGFRFFPGEFKRYTEFKSESRKLEWLSVRVLLKEMLGEYVPIVYNNNRKPYLYNSNYRISISHSKSLTSIMLSDKWKIGIDLEKMSHKIVDIKNRFINENEYITQDKSRIRQHLFIHWCAKEALYKLCDKQDINLRDNLTLDPFEPKERGTICGWVNNTFWHDKFDLDYFMFEDYVIVYCFKKHLISATRTTEV